jgi:hypothetical protein
MTPSPSLSFYRVGGCRWSGLFSPPRLLPGIYPSLNFYGASSWWSGRVLLCSPSPHCCRAVPALSFSLRCSPGVRSSRYIFQSVPALTFFVRSSSGTIPAYFPILPFSLFNSCRQQISHQSMVWYLIHLPGIPCNFQRI